MNNIPCPLREAAGQCGDHAAIVSGSREITYARLDRLVNVTFDSLKKFGIKKGSTVAILSSNILEYPILLFSLWRMGAVACLVNTRYPPKSVMDFLRKMNRSSLSEARFL